MSLRSAYDLIVIGAGINGAAIARELALQGFSVLLLDRGDLASGASSASTRLIHGGLRYLEHAEFALVRESLDERERLLRLAPHRVEPLEIHIPVYAGARRGRWKIGLGLTLYEALFRSRRLPRHRRLGTEALRQRLPGLATAGLVGGFAYFDAAVRYAERLVLENVLDAVAAGAELATYCEARPRVAGGDVQGVDWRCTDGPEGSAAARCVINAAGPWADRVVHGLGRGPRLTLSKGSHLVLRRFPGAPEAALYFEAARDGRPMFAIPWNGLLLVGTTELEFEGDPSEVAASAAETDYLLAELTRLWPGAASAAAAICYTQSGLRPLPRASSGDLGAVTRQYLVYEERAARGLYSIVGGKLTTHRALAEHVLGRVAPRLGRRTLASRTRRRPLPGALDPQGREQLCVELAAELGPSEAERLYGIYGARAERVLALARASPELAERLGPDRKLLVAELVYALDEEWARTLADLLLRRTMAGLEADFGLGAAPAAAAALTRLGIWDAERAAGELAAYRALAHKARAAASGAG